MPKNEIDPNAPLTVGEVMLMFQKIMEQQSEQQKEVIRVMVAEIRKPPHDPVKEARDARVKETKEKAEKEMWDKKRRMYTQCSHLRQDGTSNIAWATQSDGVKRGMCPYCSSDFSPEMTKVYPDLADLYQKMLKVPTGRMENVRYVS